jgi:hypothetical protein
MRGAGHDRTSGDPIAEYLDQLRAGLRAAPREAELILAEAEDHLRETAAAGVAIGMTERESQEAAISSFGPVQAVVRAHLTRLIRVGAIVGEVAMAAWKLASFLVLAVGVSGLVTAVVFRLAAHPIYAPSGVQIIVVHPGVRWLGWSAMVVVGAALLAGYGLVRRRQRRRGLRHELLLAGFFPVVAASFFGAIAIALIGLDMSGTRAVFAPGLAVAACLALAVGYAVRMARTLLHKG